MGGLPHPAMCHPGMSQHYTTAAIAAAAGIGHHLSPHSGPFNPPSTIVHNVTTAVPPHYGYHQTRPRHAANQIAAVAAADFFSTWQQQYPYGGASRDQTAPAIPFGPPMYN